jgi:hypothetical protein
MLRPDRGLPEPLDLELSRLFKTSTSFDDWCGYPETIANKKVSFRGVSYYNKKKINEHKRQVAKNAKFKILCWSRYSDFCKVKAKEYVDSLRPPMKAIKSHLRSTGYSQMEVDFIVTPENYPFLEDVHLTKRDYNSLCKLIENL